jgi:hypothetical protein
MEQQPILYQMVQSQGMSFIRGIDAYLEHEGKVGDTDDGLHVGVGVFLFAID